MSWKTLLSVRKSSLSISKILEIFESQWWKVWDEGKVMLLCLNILYLDEARESKRNILIAANELSPKCNWWPWSWKNITSSENNGKCVYWKTTSSLFPTNKAYGIGEKDYWCHEKEMEMPLHANSLMMRNKLRCSSLHIWT